jgi:hypothetical protein
MTDNERLIEEAARADFYATPDDRIWEDISDKERTLRLRGMAAALAVFEKAHTPTDDEREALVSILYVNPWSQTKYSLGHIAEKILTAGFRCTVPQGEPSDAQVAVDAAWKQFQRMPSSNPSDYAHAVVAALRAAGV